MKLSLLECSRAFIILSLLLFSLIANGEIFKWVDGNGRTHYSDIKVSAGTSKVEELKVDSSPNIIEGYSSEPVQTQTPKKEGLDSRLRRFERLMAQKRNGPTYKIRKTIWNTKGPETDEKRCALANDIVNGLASRAGMDAHDLKVAQRDIIRFCH